MSRWGDFPQKAEKSRFLTTKCEIYIFLKGFKNLLNPQTAPAPYLPAL